MELNATAPLKILLAIENSPHFVTVVNMLIHIKWPAGTTVDLLTVMPGPLPLMDTTPENRQYIDETAEILHWRNWAATKVLTTHITATLRAYNLMVSNAEIYEGQLVETALKYATATEPDIVVIGAKTADLPGKIWLNPTTQKLAQVVHQSMLVVRPSKQVCPLHTILAVDGSPEAWQAVEFMRSLSLPNWARVTLLSLAGEHDKPDPIGPKAQPTALPNAAPTAFVNEAISYMHDCGVAVKWLQRFGPPTQEILTVAHDQEADLIVLGSKCQPQVDALPVPSLTQRLVKYAPCSVLVVR